MRFALNLLAAALALPATLGQAQLLPAGEFAARDGRPGRGRKWRVTDAQGEALAAAINAVATLTPIVIDYEHQTLRAEANGREAPAAGWIHAVEWRSGEGLFARVEWTQPAKARIESGEYRYISPVITSDEAGTVTGVHMAALVNHPALLGMAPVLAQLSAQGAFPNDKDAPMIPIALLAILGLPATATEAEALQALSALKTRAEAPPPKPALPTALVTALGLKPEADEAAALSAVQALRGADNSALALVTTLQTEVAQLRGQVQEAKLVEVVDGAIEAGKFLPVLRDHLLAQGRRDMTALQAMIAAQPVIPGLKGQTGNNSPDTGAAGTHALNATQIGIAKQLGIPLDKYAASLKAAA
jgi:phage I-like protein